MKEAMNIQVVSCKTFQICVIHIQNDQPNEKKNIERLNLTYNIIFNKQNVLQSMNTGIFIFSIS